MNTLTLIGNLISDPTSREVNTKTGVASVCSFTVAVNMPGAPKDAPGQLFRVTAWRGLGENCQKYLAKGRKVAVVGSVSASAYIGRDGQPHAGLEVSATNVEFLSSATQAQAPVQTQAPAQTQAPVRATAPAPVQAQAPVQPVQQAQPVAQPDAVVPAGFTAVETDELPF